MEIVKEIELELGGSIIKFFTNDIITFHKYYNQLEKSTKILVMNDLQRICEKEILRITKEG